MGRSRRVAQSSRYSPRRPVVSRTSVAMGDVAADAIAPFDCPDPVRPLPAEGQHLGIAVPVGGESTLPRMVSSPDITSIVTDRLCGFMPVTTRCASSTAFLRCSIKYWFSSREGNATSS